MQLNNLDCCAASCCSLQEQDFEGFETRELWDESIVTTDIKENDVGSRFRQGKGINGIKKDGISGSAALLLKNSLS